MDISVKDKSGLRLITTSLAFLKGRVKTDDMTRHSLLMVAFVISSGFFNYLYQLFMGILLTPEQYGVLFSLTSLFIIITVFSETITIAIARFTSKLKADGRLDGVNHLWHFSLKRVLIFGTVAFIFLVAMSPLISRFLHIDNMLYPVILFSAVLVILVLSVNWGTLQGLQIFLPLGASRALAGFLRAFFGAALVYSGTGIYGGLAAIPIAFGIALPLTFFSLRNVSRAGNERVATAHSYSYAYAGLTSVAMFSIIMLTNVDVVLAKHYLGVIDAGNYSAISVLGRIAYYAPTGVAIAMFPKTSELFENGGNYRRLFLRALFLTLVIGGGVVLVYGLFSDLITRFLFGSRYPLATPYLAMYAMAMAFFSISYLTMTYLLSLGKTKVAYALLIALFLQIGLIAIFHTDIAQLVHVMLICGISSVVLIFFFYLKEVRR